MIEIKCRGADILPLDAIEDFQGGLKKRSKSDIDKIIKSIEIYGFSFPFFVWNGDGHNRCIDGHGRIQALCQMRQKGENLPMFPVVYIEAVDEAEAKQKLLRLNSQYGQMTMESVMEFTQGLDMKWDELNLPDGRMDFGDASIVDTKNDDEVPEQVEPKTKLGDLYDLGANRLLCGDSTDAEQVARLMDGQKADMVFTDPPYGMNLDTDYSKMGSTTTKYKKIAGDDADFNISFIFKLIPSPIYYIWGAEYLYDSIPKFKQGSLVVWAKRQSAEENKVFGSAYELCWVFPKIKKEIWFVRAINQSSERLGLHPTQKPTELGVRAIQDRTEEGNVIVDLFLGSGSTLISCEKTNRVCYGMELDPHYCDVIVARYKQWCADNGREAIVKLNGELVA